MRGPPIKEEPKSEIPPEQAIRKASVKEIEKRLKRIVKIMDELLDRAATRRRIEQ